MDAVNLGRRRAVAMARIETALDELTKTHGFSLDADGVTRTRANDPIVTDLLRLEGIADLIDSLVEAVRQVGTARGSAGRRNKGG